MKKPVCPKGVFVVGTDTNVGKTIIAAGVARGFRRRGERVAVFKPFLSGDPQAVDAQILARAAGLAGPGLLQPALLDVISPFRFKDPVAPGIGALRENRTVKLSDVEDEARALGNMADAMVVEGAGGLLVPLTSEFKEDSTVLDLVIRLGLPVLIVARTALGTINHTALTVMALRYRQVPIAGIVMSQTDPADSNDADQILAITDLTGIKPAGTLPYTTGSEAILVGTATRMLEASGLMDALCSTLVTPQPAGLLPE